MGEMLVPFLLSLGAEIPVDMGETSDEEEIWPVSCSQNDCPPHARDPEKTGMGDTMRCFGGTDLFMVELALGSNRME